MTRDRRAALERGVRAEQLVSDLLDGQGWTVLARNWRGGRGELDLVVERERCLRFVEVKARGPEDPWPDQAVTPAKQRRLVSAARTWLAGMDHEPDEACFLVAMVTCGPGPWEVELIDDAFDGG